MKTSRVTAIVVIALLLIFAGFVIYDATKPNEDLHDFHDRRACLNEIPIYLTPAEVDRRIEACNG